MHRIRDLTRLHIDQEIPYTLDYDLIQAFLDEIYVVVDPATNVVGCFEHVIDAPFNVKDRIFLKGIKQFPYINEIPNGALVNCCQSSGVGKGSHRAMYQFQKDNWNDVWTWISVKSPLWPVLEDLGWIKKDTFKFFNIWKGAESTFQLGVYHNWDWVL